MELIIIWFVGLVSAYLLGSIPTAYLVVHYRKGFDIRKLGDGNSGAANVARVMGAKTGIFVGIVDIFKGSIILALAGWLLGSGIGMAGGIIAIMGHSWPIYLLGRGGRGAAVGIGVLLALLPYLAFPIALIGIIILGVTRKTRLAIAFFFITLPVLVFLVGNYSLVYLGYTLLIPVIVGICHFISVIYTTKGLAGAI
ncbi:MAG: glycerol-3-phosphate acyltransferase [Chloroflexota bacterium]|nr:glycerol-3-phosphate acyltransferase [Chloroflexota bacterium]MEE2687294.1 glycerol-3-phosphate acyltransferase [Chloroflexota bacterium]MEE2880446.1 glycerol-3-phosphate acyltransferase [Chloroflexota bacterium]